ncbi:MAG: hypothetical protein J0H23_02805 [Micrococcales bacterium]|nr:hypothetical protein [Micrococcales bacterium]OJX66403.1 MAG: hypothetical protein BGO94_05875 [Micrococcales bacterium 72-143]
MEIAGATPLGWLLFLAFAVFCGFAAFYLVYGAVRVFEGESSDAASTWLLDHRTPIVIVLTIVGVIVIAVAAGNA